MRAPNGIWWACCLAACTAADPESVRHDAGGNALEESGVDTGPPNPFEGELAPVLRGEYLVNHVVGCGECHTPRGHDLQIDRNRHLSGVVGLFDLLPENPGAGQVNAPNLTPDPATGLGSWTDEEIKRAFLEGVRPDGHTLSTIMPYFVFYNMLPEDADAIVAYLRSLPPIENAVPHHETLPDGFAEPAEPVPLAAIPDTTLAASDTSYELAQRGRYLAGRVGMCLYCHTEPSTPADPVPIRIDRLFMGRRKLYPFPFGGELPENAPLIDTKNLTPAPGGLEGWTAEEVRAALKLGMDRSGLSICAPMPVGPRGAFGMLTDHDALAIGTYLTSLEPRDNGSFEACCTACHREGGLAGG